MQKWFYVNIYHVAVPLFYDYFLFPMFPSCWQMSVVFYHHVMHGLGFFIGSFWNQWIIRALSGQNSLCCKSWLHCTFKTVPNMPGSASVICHKLNEVNIFPFNTSRETCKFTLIKFKTKDFFFLLFSVFWPCDQEQASNSSWMHGQILPMNWMCPFYISETLWMIWNFNISTILLHNFFQTS